MKRSAVVCLVLSAGLMTTSSAEAQIWNLKDDWTLTSPGAGISFGPDNAWSVRANDGATGPTNAFVDSTEAYFTPSGCSGGGCATMQYIAGYAVTKDAVFKTYDNDEPWLDPNEVVKPADHNLDPNAGLLDSGDIGAKAGSSAADIVWKAPRDMIIDAEYLAYSVGTHLSAAVGGNVAESRLHFLVRNVPGTGPINPEGEPDIRVPGYNSGTGREYRSQKIVPFAVTAGQELYLKVNRVDPDLGGPLQPSHPDRNVVGFSKIQVRDLTNIFEWRPDSPGAWEMTSNWDERIGAEAAVVTNYPGDTMIDPNESQFTEHQVIFADEISSGRSVSLDSSVSVRAIEFDNASSSFSVTGNGTINLVASTDPNNPLPTELRATSGVHELQVEVDLATNGKVIVGDDSTLELHKEIDLVGNTLTIEPTAGGSQNGAVLLNTSVAGSGTVINSATLSTGLPAMLSTASLNSTGTLDFDIYPNGAGQLLVGGSATIDGSINVDFLDGATPSGEITLVTSTSPISLPSGLPSLDVTGVSGLFSLALSGDNLSLLLSLDGDFNGDGRVDGFDLLEWQRNPGIGNLSDWEANYGTPITAITTTVPEPSSALLAFAALAMLGLTRT